MNRLMIKIQEQKANLSVQDENIEDLIAQLEERTTTITSLTANNDQVCKQPDIQL